MTDSNQLKLSPIKRDIIEIPIIGLSPVIPHKWSEKALRQMRESQSGTKARAKKEPKDPVTEAEACTYRLSDGRPGIPAAAFKAATTAAARYYDGVTMVSLKAALFVLPTEEGQDQLIAIDHSPGDRVLREDTPRNSGGVADLRYRYAYFPWSALLRVEYVPQMIDAESVINLVDAGGSGGVGDWRPSAPKSMTGSFGRYQVNVGGR